jgi:uncharacterized protein YkwD
MRKTAIFFIYLVLLMVLTPFFVRSASSTQPPPPSNRRAVRPDASEVQKAAQLYQLARRENRRLIWDPCLARKAFLRAKQLVKDGYFDHEDPKTGTNPVWMAIRDCYSCSSGGENLVKGMDTPENIHQALMESPTHRKNILDPRFNLVGIGCYDYICVELFAGI